MYQVIARKFRPQTFADVVNQEHVKRTLTNALTQNRVGHGYIFSGQRGTGKTTMARILAKALNCEKGPGPEPCLACSSCREIAAGNSMDLVEIDAASNRRIDDIRELRESVRYRPVRDRYKVFIIDEAHQITPDAFNALLKTLEEPPEWVVFILCTTEPHDIPPTIASRCQGFPFRAVELDQIAGRVQWICEQEGVDAEPDAVIAIALAGDGSIRDALSTLDQAIACFGNRLEAGPVRDLLGAIPSEITDQIVASLAKQDSADMLAVVDRIVGEGRDVQQFCGELSRYFRNLLVMKVSGAGTKLVSAGPDERKRLAASLDHFSREDLTRYLQLLLDLYRDLQFAVQPRFRLEIGLLKLVYASHLQPIEKVIETWSRGGAGEKAPAGSGPAAPANSGPPASAGPAAQETSEPPRPAGPSAAALPQGEAIETARHPEARATEARDIKTQASEAQATSPLPSPPTVPVAAGQHGDPQHGDLKSKLLIALHSGDAEHLADAVEHGLIHDHGHEVEVRSTADYRASLEIDFDSLKQVILQLLGRKVPVKLGEDLTTAESASREAPGGASNGQSPSSTGASTRASTGAGAGVSETANDQLTRRALDDPGVQKIRDLFDGQIREVRNLRGYSS